MNQQKVQTDIPAEGGSPDNNPTGATPHGIPKGMEDEEATGTPNSDRNKGEKAVQKSGKG